MGEGGAPCVDEAKAVKALDTISNCPDTLLASPMLSIIIKKLRCQKKKADGREYSLRRSTELTIYAYYSANILWDAFYFLTIYIVPLSRALAPNTDPSSLCKIRYTIPVFLLLQLFGLVNILTNRVNASFNGTELALSKCTNHAIRSASCIVCSVFLAVVAFKYFLHDIAEEGVDSDCSVDEMMSDEEALPAVIAFMLMTLGFTLSLFTLFMVKLVKFSVESKMSGLDTKRDPFFINLIHKQSVIMFWVTVSTAASATFLGLIPIIDQALGSSIWEYMYRMPLEADLTINSIAIFLSFSFNQFWYELCRCDKCAQCFVDCFIGSWKRCKGVQRNRPSDVELCVQYNTDTVRREYHASDQQPVSMFMDNDKANKTMSGDTPSSLKDVPMTMIASSSTGSGGKNSVQREEDIMSNKETPIKKCGADRPSMDTSQGLARMGHNHKNSQSNMTMLIHLGNNSV